MLIHNKFYIFFSFISSSVEFIRLEWDIFPNHFPPFSMFYYLPHCGHLNRLSISKCPNAMQLSSLFSFSHSELVWLLIQFSLQQSNLFVSIGVRTSWTHKNTQAMRTANKKMNWERNSLNIFCFFFFWGKTCENSLHISIAVPAFINTHSFNIFYSVNFSISVFDWIICFLPFTTDSPLGAISIYK